MVTIYFTREEGGYFEEAQFFGSEDELVGVLMNPSRWGRTESRADAVVRLPVDLCKEVEAHSIRLPSGRVWDAHFFGFRENGGGRYDQRFRS
jgi:hypothetical protein